VSRESQARVPELVLGILPADEQVAVAAELAKPSPVAAELAAEIRLSARAVEAALVDALPAVPLGAGARARLLATLASPGRFRAFFPTLRRWFDLDDQGLSAVIARIDAGTAWKSTPFPGMRYFRFAPGPAALGRESGCVALAAGTRFPRHQHLGEERSMVLEGSLMLDGRRIDPGEAVESPPGSAHELVACPGRDVVILTSHDGLSFLE
jgi:hypothetical protein